MGSYVYPFARGIYPYDVPPPLYAAKLLHIPAASLHIEPGYG